MRNKRSKIKLGIMVASAAIVVNIVTDWTALPEPLVIPMMVILLLGGLSVLILIINLIDEIIFYFMEKRMNRDQQLSYARMFAEGRYSDASIQKVAAFSGAVVYLMTGASGGYGGPSIREHAVSYAALESGRPGGDYSFDEACQFAGPIVFGPLTELHQRVHKNEYCFDDDPDDEKKIAAFSGGE